MGFKERKEGHSNEHKTETQERIIREESRRGNFRNAEAGVGSCFSRVAREELFVKIGRQEQAQEHRTISHGIATTPLAGSGLDLERNKGQGRNIEL